MTLDEILHAQPATLPPEPPRRAHKRHDYTGWHQRHPQGAQAPTDALHEQLGAEWFDPEPSPPRAPQVIPDGMYLIRDVARSLGRSQRTIRAWIDKGVIPDAPQRTAGGVHEGGLGTTTTAKRLWPAAEINAMVEIAREEGIIDKPHAAWKLESNFRQRVWDAITELRAG